MAKEPLKNCIYCGLVMSTIEAECLNCELFENRREMYTKASIADYYRQEHVQLSVGRLIHPEDLPDGPDDYRMGNFR